MHECKLPVLRVFIREHCTCICNLHISTNANIRMNNWEMIIEDRLWVWVITLSPTDQPLWFLRSSFDRHPQNRFTSCWIPDQWFIKELSERFDSNLKVLFPWKYACILFQNVPCVWSTPWMGSIPTFSQAETSSMSSSLKFLLLP
jgi:hypothetical protein